VTVLRRGLSQAGYVEGRNLMVEIVGMRTKLIGLRRAADLVQTSSDCDRRKRVASARAAKAANPRIPIVCVAADPVQSGLLAASIARKQLTAQLFKR